jgi:hypothetical protein
MSDFNAVLVGMMLNIGFNAEQFEGWHDRVKGLIKARSLHKYLMDNIRKGTKEAQVDHILRENVEYAQFKQAQHVSEVWAALKRRWVKSTLASKLLVCEQLYVLDKPSTEGLLAFLNCRFYQRNKEQGMLKPPGWYKANHKRKKGQRSKHQLSQVPQGQFAGALITPAAFQPTTAASNGFIIDSGATHHMVNKVSLLRNTQAVDVKVLTANQQAVTCTLEGEAIVKTDTGKQVLLKEVLLLPALTCNLLSVRKANEVGLKVAFTRNGNVTVMAQAPQRLLMSGRASGSLYELVGHALTLSMVAAAAHNPPISAPSNLIATRFLNTLGALWHSRLGHLNYTSLAKMAANRRAKGLPTSGVFPQPAPCWSCTSGKLPRKPFPVSANRTCRPMEQVHTDIAGPMQVTSAE